MRVPGVPSGHREVDARVKALAEKLNDASSSQMIVLSEKSDRSERVIQNRFRLIRRCGLI